MQILTIALSALLLPTGALAWGAYGHETVAYVAASFVSAPTRTFFQSLLGDASADYLAGVATFADSYRSTAAGGFSAPFHYVDARDSPPGSCGVSYSRDCGPGGCVISAISNYVGDPFRPPETQPPPPTPASTGRTPRQASAHEGGWSWCD